MVLMHPRIVIFGIIIAAAFISAMHFLKRRKTEYSGGTRAANADFVRGLPEYRRRMIIRRVLLILAEVLLIASIVLSLILTARPYKTQTVTSGTKKRDIFICLDVSYSICYLNYDLVESLKDVVGDLKGDRFGITVFNTSTVLYVPLTDDYDFVNEKLEELKTYFGLQIELEDMVDEDGYIIVPDDGWEEYAELREKLDYYDAGTLINNHLKGSSLIGEGLAACLYSFPSLGDEERTRAIIMATDNAQENISTPLVELKEACELCRKNDVTVFAIFPDRETFNKGNNRDYDADKSDLRNNIAVTGGEYYEQSANLTTEDIVKDIQRQEALEVDEITVTRMTDKPVGLIIALFCCLAGLLVTGLMLKR
ncbi:MAG: hypothetical protein IKG59_00210 [Firmicutes bacterium]|nr:hypothetical protein [Bacillota bacterium]MBR3052535.1 hypothetical protein [Bacillota bacterium]